MAHNYIVKLMTCDNSFQANVVKGRLISEGIDAFLNNENMSTLYQGINSTFTTVDVFVKECDYDKALEIINESPEQDS